MCIEGTPSKIYSLSPDKAITAWREWDLSKTNLADGSTREELVPAGTGMVVRPRAWRGCIAKAHKRPTGKRASDVGLHAKTRPTRFNPLGSVAGKVRLFGRVVEHRRGGVVTGYLAEYAEIVGLSVKHSTCHDAATRVPEVARLYGVKVLA
jgi:hypothetical protein